MIGWFVSWLERLVKLGIDLMMALIGGLLKAPFTGAQRALGPVTVRTATGAEVVDVRHRVLREGRPRETAVFDGDDAPDTRHWVATTADLVVGVVTVRARDDPDDPDGPHWQLRGMAVLPDWQGREVGSAMLSSVHADVAEAMWCNARTRAVPFYERHGWTSHGDPFVIDPIGPHRRMRWAP